MAPTDLTDRASKSKSQYRFTITSAVVKKGRPTVLKYSWTYDPKRSYEDDRFAVAVYNLATKEQTFLDYHVYTHDHGKGNTGTWTVDISSLKDKLGKYLLLFVLIDFDDYVVVAAKGKPFHVRKGDF
ncbi:hypothetical protein M407DRAFT_17707 [Tulasnella calospora MUT 4182]|uniref:Uncharacterized protein n=1 Tax=Tulasnella calospora MUT 4182 TaxID=1051891 RepID=A0A0C3MIE7_9AGAM|nr:hypothetical protein M407DRAFT_17707 [Tulasnella calospora MUT 4182]